MVAQVVLREPQVVLFGPQVVLLGPQVVLRAKSHAVFNNHCFFMSSKQTQKCLFDAKFWYQNIVSTFMYKFFTK
jgi:hypothetical protein